MGRTAGTWEALGTWATAVVALGAAYLALKQIRAAEEIRRKESWPYVAIYMETVESMPQFNISYQSPDGEKHSHTYELDWATHLGRRWVAVRPVHDAAKSLAKVEKTIAKWSESARGDISVYVRDGDKKDAERREAIEQQDDEFAAFRARNRDREAMSTEFDAEDDDSRPATDVNGVD